MTPTRDLSTWTVETFRFLRLKFKQRKTRYEGAAWLGSDGPRIAGRGVEPRFPYVGTWDGGSQWCNRLPGTCGVVQVVFVLDEEGEVIG